MRRRAEVLWAGDKASQALGMTVNIERVGAATVRMAVRDDMLNGFDVCHGGILFALRTLLSRLRVMLMNPRILRRRLVSIFCGRRHSVISYARRRRKSTAAGSTVITR